jgi:hypothetical protein
MERRLHQGAQPVEAEPYIDGGEDDEDARGRRKIQHRPLRINRARSSALIASRQRMIQPEGALIFMARPLRGAFSGASR